MKTAFALMENTIAVHYVTREGEVVIEGATFKGIKIPLNRFTDTEIGDLEQACRDEERSRSQCLRER